MPVGPMPITAMRLKSSRLFKRLSRSVHLLQPPPLLLHRLRHTMRNKPNGMRNGNSTMRNRRQCKHRRLRRRPSLEWEQVHPCNISFYLSSMSMGCNHRNLSILDIQVSSLVDFNNRLARLTQGDQDHKFQDRDRVPTAALRTRGNELARVPGQAKVSDQGTSIEVGLLEISSSDQSNQVALVHLSSLSTHFCLPNRQLLSEEIFRCVTVFRKDLLHQDQQGCKAIIGIEAHLPDLPGPNNIIAKLHQQWRPTEPISTTVQPHAVCPVHLLARRRGHNEFHSFLKLNCGREQNRRKRISSSLVNGNSSNRASKG